MARARSLTLSSVCAITLFSLAGCASAPVAVSGACPELPQYSNDLQDQAADELEKLPEGSVLGNIMIPDYGRMRDAVRECLKARKK